MECTLPLEAERDRLEIALGVLAALVAKDTAFLPFFQHIEEELNRMNASTSALDRARQIAARQRAMR
ncbi:hypothetical protein LHP98_12975 [Rhodobacter sp. Har01]|uniref:hypothetical protein n=1 Tax=Rhodobacter sp. Har01 TaxID=2883999 RepID=UPI001D0849D5|nr:hypothetical protein [Rhodobacter sp. Har01]MCB6179038.1 hypothetical protein [Rhodobacter sp. Har01]